MIINLNLENKKIIVVGGGNEDSDASRQLKRDAAISGKAKKPRAKGGGRSGSSKKSNNCGDKKSASNVDSHLGDWKVVMLMDLREFGQQHGSNFLDLVEQTVNSRFGGVHCEKMTLPSADYMFVARLISKTNTISNLFLREK